jgi:hypothetical protein
MSSACRGRSDSRGYGSGVPTGRVPPKGAGAHLEDKLAKSTSGTLEGFCALCYRLERVLSSTTSPDHHGRERRHVTFGETRFAEHHRPASTANPPSLPSAPPRGAGAFSRSRSASSAGPKGSGPMGHRFLGRIAASGSATFLRSSAGVNVSIWDMLKAATGMPSALARP